MHRRAVKKPAATLPLFLLARRFAGSLWEDIWQTNANAVEAWETLLQEENVPSGRSEVYPLAFGLFFLLAPLLLVFLLLPVLASLGAGRITPPPAHGSVWEYYKSAAGPIYICHPFCSVV